MLDVKRKWTTKKYEFDIIFHIFFYALIVAKNKDAKIGNNFKKYYACIVFFITFLEKM